MYEITKNKFKSKIETLQHDYGKSVSVRDEFSHNKNQ